MRKKKEREKLGRGACATLVEDANNLIKPERYLS